MFNLEKELLNWINESNIVLFEHQKESFNIISSGNNLLLSSATGTGKTLSAFLPVLNEIIKKKKSNIDTSFMVFYISPLKALIDDLYINLSEITKYLEEKENIKISIFKRSGDTSYYHRSKMVSNKPEIILTTPESFNLLTINKQEVIAGFKYIILDELHNLIESKRGVNLFLNLIKVKQYIVIGLSATINPLDKILNILGKNTKLVEGKLERQRIFKSFTPKTKFWINYKQNQSEMYNKLLEEVKKYKCSIVFTNTRKLAESITCFLRDNLLDDMVLIHHGSLSKEIRYETQENMKLGKAKVVVSSTSLELGVDIGYVEHVFQISSPKSISRSLQRLGRAGHSFDKLISGTFFSSTVEENIENSVILNLASKNIVDDIRIPKGYLDVLCQFIISVGFLKIPVTKNQLFLDIKNVYFYKELTEKDYELVINYLLKNKKIYFSDQDKILTFSKYNSIFIRSAGFIEQDTFIPVFLHNTNHEIGSISAEFFSELKKNTSFVISGRRFICTKITLSKLFVKFDFGNRDILPKWYSEVLPLNFFLAKNIRNFQIDTLNKLLKKQEVTLQGYVFNKEAKISMLEHFKEQSIWLEINGIQEIQSTDILIEIVRKKVIFHTLFGRQINSCLSKILSINVSKLFKTTTESFFQDNGFILSLDKELTEKEIKKLFSLSEKDILNNLRSSLSNTQVFLDVFKKNVYSCMFLHKVIGKNMNALELKFLMYTLIKEKNNLIIEQTYREIFQDKFDIERSIEIYSSIKNKNTNLLITSSDYISPFGNYIYISDIDSSAEKSNLIQQLRVQTDYHFSCTLLNNQEKINFFPLGVFFSFQGKNILVISDLHLNENKEIFYKNLGQLDSFIVSMNFYLNLIKPKTVILLGDIKDNIFYTSNIEKQCLEKFLSFLKQKVEEIFLIKGNHDAKLDIDIKTFDYLIYDDIFLTHGHKNYDISNYKYVILGHEHTNFELEFDSGIKKTLDCFLVLNTKKEKKVIVLPSISKYKKGIDNNKKNSFLSPILKNNILKNKNILVFFSGTWYKKNI